MKVDEVCWLSIFTDEGLTVDGPMPVKGIDEIMFHLTRSRDDIKQLFQLKMSSDWKMTATESKLG